MSNRADLREHTKTMIRHSDRRGQIADFRGSFETINWLYLLFFKCGIKTKTHFEWLLWHWSSLGQLNLEPTRPFAKCQLTSWRSVSKKPRTWVFIILLPPYIIIFVRSLSCHYLCVLPHYIIPYMHSLYHYFCVLPIIPLLMCPLLISFLMCNPSF